MTIDVWVGKRREMMGVKPKKNPLREREREKRPNMEVAFPCACARKKNEVNMSNIFRRGQSSNLFF